MKATTVAEASAVVETMADEMAVKELRNRDRYLNGVVKSAQLRFIRLTNQAPSQCVAASHSDFWKG
jgi:hypothetical protein